MCPITPKSKLERIRLRIIRTGKNCKAKGNEAENFAKDFLLKQGLTFVQNQYRSSRGEIDLIMKDKTELVFVEVRYRKQSHFADPIETITWQKQQRIIYTARVFHQCHPWAENFDQRFDVIAIYGNQLNFKITWIADAFRVE